MNFHDFQSRYGFHLLPFGDAGIHLGDKVHDPRFGEPNMPGKNIVYDLKQHGLLATTEEKELIGLLRNKEKDPGEFAQVSIEAHVNDKVDLKIPGIGDLSGQIDHSKDIRYDFTNVEVRTLDNQTRSEHFGEGLALALEQKLNEFRETDQSSYKDEFRRGFLNLGWISIVTKLVYARVELHAEKGLGGDIDIAVERLPVDATFKGESENKLNYSFESTEVPFAMQVQKVNAFG